MQKQVLRVVAGCLCLLAVCAGAGPRWIKFELSHGATSTNILTQTKSVNGYIDEFYWAGPSQSGVTTDVYVTVSPSIDTNLSVAAIYTNSALTAAAKTRTRIPQTDSAGSDLSSLTVAERYLCKGDKVTVRIEQVSAVTNVTYKGFLKVDQ